MRYSQGETKLLEKICLGFAASTLYLLVQPVPDDIHKVQAQVSSPPPLLPPSLPMKQILMNITPFHYI